MFSFKSLNVFITPVLKPFSVNSIICTTYLRISSFWDFKKILLGWVQYSLYPGYSVLLTVFPGPVVTRQPWVFAGVPPAWPCGVLAIVQYSFWVAVFVPEAILAGFLETSLTQTQFSIHPASRGSISPLDFWRPFSLSPILVPAPQTQVPQSPQAIISLSSAQGDHSALLGLHSLLRDLCSASR